MPAGAGFERIRHPTNNTWLHNETTLEYARQITAEEKQVNEKGIEKWESIRADNHYLDCECIASALADWEWPGGGVNLFPDPNQAGNKVKKSGNQEHSTGQKNRPSWFNKR